VWQFPFIVGSSLCCECTKDPVDLCHKESMTRWVHYCFQLRMLKLGESGNSVVEIQWYGGCCYLNVDVHETRTLQLSELFC
jgi:hypothetical protein